MDKKTKITLDILLDRKLKSENDKKKVVLFDSEILGGTIEIEKLRAKDVMALMGDVTDNNNAEEGIRLNNKLIYKHCSIFRNEELQKAYNVAEPYDVILEVLDQNIGEVNKLCNAILNLYGLGEKILEKEADDIKN